MAHLMISQSSLLLAGSDYRVSNGAGSGLIVVRTVPSITVHVNVPLFQGDVRLFERNLALSSGAGKSWSLSGNKARPLDTRAFGASRMFSRCRRLDVIDPKRSPFFPHYAFRHAPALWV